MTQSGNAKADPQKDTTISIGKNPDCPSKQGSLKAVQVRGSSGETENPGPPLDAEMNLRNLKLGTSEC